jgi:2-iminobutanoate/2-iminopropanoate deaminase
VESSPGEAFGLPAGCGLQPLPGSFSETSVGENEFVRKEGRRKAIKTIATDKAPAAIGPYSQAVKVGNFIHTSGQIPIDPRTNQIVSGGIRQQTGQVLENLRLILKAGGAGLENVVKTTVFLKDMADFASFNEIYSRFFTRSLPARSTVEVAALPKGALIEIEAIAVLE